ncbi:MAG: 6-phosphogluconolactonase [Gemmatimonadota bacterium]|nr:6-phosphogluconolactonase [Gemmatimonadota bacterium]
MRSTDASRTVVVLETLEVVAEAAAREIAEAAADAAAQRGRFVVALAGGETPRPLYRLLAREYRDGVAWDRAEICFGDERCVPPHNPASNFRMAWSTLLADVPVIEERIHRIAGELGSDAAARDYDARLRRLFVDDAGRPTFDVAVMGVGADGHTASLFPGDAALEDRRRWAAPALAPADAKVRERVTLTLPVLNRARLMLFLCAGAEKRDVVARILSGAAPELPAARVHGVERTVWLLDRAAAG